MKKLLILANVIFTVFAGVAKDRDIVSEARKSNMEFKKIDVSRCVCVIVEERKEGNIIIRAEHAVMPHVELEVRDSTLYATISNSYKIQNRSPKVEILVPYNGKINEIECRGAASVILKPIIKQELFKVDCSGASNVEFSSESVTTNVGCRGASSVIGNATSQKYNVACSGASSVKSIIKCTQMSCECIGASKLYIEGSVQKAELECSGASKANIEKLQCENLKANVTRGSQAYITAANCDVTCSGASKAKANCSTRLDVEVSGASNVTYSGECYIGKLENHFGTIKKKQ
ncbi:MAG: DUF2807 domain-containing protein [Alistipes sp.]|nr:DUF2807 domain-containing protein [Candidatus Alistipes equi]